MVTLLSGELSGRVNSNIHENEQLDDLQKLTYLCQAIQDLASAPLLSRFTTTPHQYQDLVTFLKLTYDQRRLIHKHHTMSIVNCPAINNLFDNTIRHSISCLKVADQFIIVPTVRSSLPFWPPSSPRLYRTPLTPQMWTFSLSFWSTKRKVCPLPLPFRQSQTQWRSIQGKTRPHIILYY